MPDSPITIVPASPQTLAPAPDRRGVAVLLWQVLTATTEVAPLAPPSVPPHLPELSPPLRLHAALRLFLLDVEYALSPGGQLRGLAKFVCRVAIALGVMMLALAAVLVCIALVLGVAVIITGQLVTILWNLLTAALLLVGLLAVGVGLLLMVRFLTHSRPSPGGRPPLDVNHDRLQRRP